MFCPACGNEVLAEDLFCRVCGKKLSIQASSPSTAATPAPARAPSEHETGAKEHDGDAETAPKEIGGWLLLFSVGATILNPLLAVSALLQLHTAGDPWAALYIVSFVAVALFGTTAGVLLFRVHRWAVRVALIYLLSLLFFSIGTLVLVSRPDNGSLLRNVIYVVVWTAYFTTSKRVKNTFGSNA